MTFDKSMFDKLPTFHMPVKRSELLAQIAAMEEAQAKEKAMHKKMFIAGAVVAGVAAAAAGAYMFLRKKEITIQLNCEISDKPEHQAADACCCTEDEPVDAVEKCCVCEAAVVEDAAEEAAQCCCAEEIPVVIAE